MTIIQALSVAIIGAALLLLVQQHRKVILLAYARLALTGWVGEKAGMRVCDFLH